ncbi:MAG TPA: DUF1330 domain-containing protein [Myxococcota bacterium]|nr:DUF1330 domain-containing protein [Myxococcota bacterium]
MAAYLIADAEIVDSATFDEYKRRVEPVIAKFGGRYLVRGGPHTVFEGDFKPHRLVMIEFPNMQAVTAFYHSPEYAPVLALRLPAAKMRLLAVDGV